MATSSATRSAGAAGTHLQRAREPLVIAAIVLALYLPLFELTAIQAQ